MVFPGRPLWILMTSDEDRSTEGMVNSMMTCGLDMKLGLFLARSIRSGHVQFEFWLSRCVGGALANSECSRTRDGCDGRSSAASRLRGVARRSNIPPSHTLLHLSFFARSCVLPVAASIKFAVATLRRTGYARPPAAPRVMRARH
jgi:hypothetical protein